MGQRRGDNYDKVLTELWVMTECYSIPQDDFLA